METLAYNRLRSRRYVRCRARGMSREVACAAAGYHQGGATRIERRLKGEIEQERKKLGGMLGHLPWKLGRNDARRILRSELERLVDYYGPRAKELEAQSLRSLARQIALGAAEEFHRSIETKLTREAKSGGVTPRTLKVRELVRALIGEIRAFQEAPAFPDPHIIPPGRAAGEPPQSAPVQQGSPAQPRCPRHESQPLNGCRLCAALRQMAPKRDALGQLMFQEDRDDQLPATYGEPTW